MDFDGFEDIEDDLDLTIYQDAAELTEVLVEEVIDAILFGLTEKGRFDLVLTGGTLGVAVATELCKKFLEAPEKYRGLHIWWSDERFVDSNSAERNAVSLHGKLDHTPIEVHEALSPNSPATIEDAVADYERQLEGVTIDLNILGVGPDGHVASLFPGFANLEDLCNVFAITDSPKPPAERISFTMAFINKAREVWIIASGDSKADAVASIIEADTSIPASYVSGRERTRLIVDQAAFMGE
jgi:6-phosphogluconolactonase